MSLYLECIQIMKALRSILYHILFSASVIIVQAEPNRPDHTEQYQLWIQQDTGLSHYQSEI